MNQLFISFAAGFRAGVTGLLATGVGGPGLGMGVAIGSLAATATETNQGALVRRPGFSPGAGLTGLFTAVALGGYVFTAILDSQTEKRGEAALQNQQAVAIMAVSNLSWARYGEALIYHDANASPEKQKAQPGELSLC
ncbi:MAG: hypothetical protein NDJ24_04685 [Alphaproteobacteria bacterium]|nr:hypothetical protein [Alphaproteobacteria bacterium]